MLVESVGICVTGGLAWWLIPTYPSRGWRYLVMAISVPSFFVAGFRILFPFESPRYLLARGDYKRAYGVLVHMASFNGNKLPFELSTVETIQCSTRPSLKYSKYKDCLLCGTKMIFTYSGCHCFTQKLKRKGERLHEHCRITNTRSTNQDCSWEICQVCE